ncbi:sigma intracellular receptor 2 [Xiphophorus couchianus]|nr:sigma intracellular receptor 2 [Xiphophorus couchianus]
MEHAFLRHSAVVDFGPWFHSVHSAHSHIMAVRVLEIIFFFYFASHIPITLFIDLQALLPEHVYPQQLKNLLRWYAEEFKDPMVLDPPEWFKSFIFCEAFLQMPFFPIAAYAFLKGGCKWIRTPAIVYSTHVATTLIPILAHILFHQFPVKPHPGPQTNRERWLLASIYAPYLLVPVVLLLTMLLSSKYNPTSKPGSTSGKAKKKN